MSEIIPFTSGEWNIRVVTIDDEPWFVAADVLKALDVDRTALRRLDGDDKGVYSIHTHGGEQEATIITEPGLYLLVLSSRKPEAKAFKRWITHEVIPAIRKTGGYGQPDLSSPQGVLALAEQYHKTALELVAVTERAVKAENVVASIESKAGITLTEFHKHYFSDARAKDFFETMYRLGLLIDQRGARGRDDKGRLKNGHQHRHPTAKGKRWLYLRGSEDNNGIRRESVRVRPGTPETELRDFLTGHGLTPNRNEIGKEIAA